MARIMNNVICLSLLVISGASYAGGGGGETWYPRVVPNNCVNGMSNGYWAWNNSKDCNEVIERGYAKGVNVKGVFQYEDSSLSKFDGIVSPTQSYKPPILNKRITRIINIGGNSSEWLK